MCFLLRHHQSIVPGFYIGPDGRLVDERIIRHLVRVVDPGTVVAPAQFVLGKAVFKLVHEIPAAPVFLRGVQHIQQAVFIVALNEDKVLGVGEQGFAVHQLDDYLSVPEGIQDIAVVLRLVVGQFQYIGHILQPLYVIVALAAKVAGQLVGVILVAGHVGRQRGHADYATPVVQDSAARVHDAAVLLQRIIREKAFILRFGWNFLCFLRNHFLRLRFLGFFWYRFCG